MKIFMKLYLSENRCTLSHYQGLCKGKLEWWKDGMLDPWGDTLVGAFVWAGSQAPPGNLTKKVLLSFLLTFHNGVFPGSFELHLHISLKCSQGPGPRDTSVDEDGWGASHFQIVTEPDILVYSCHYLQIIQVLLEFLHIQTDLAGDIEKLLVVYALDILEKPVVIFPEFTLFLGSEGCDCGFFRESVIGKRKAKKNQFHLIGEFLEHLLEHGREPRTSRSLETTENSYLHRCIIRAFGGRNREVCTLGGSNYILGSPLGKTEVTENQAKKKSED